MDPPSAEDPWNKNSEHVKSQPPWQSTITPSYSIPRAVVPPGLECLIEVEEVILEKKAFFTRSEQNLFTIRRESECCGPSVNLKFQDPKKRDVVSLYTVSGEDCCGGDSHMKVFVNHVQTIGFIKISNSSSKMSVSIQMILGEPAFTAELPLFDSDNTVEILSVNGSCPVAKITKEEEKKSSKVVFQFPMDMEATLKTVILASFLYMKYQLDRLSSSSSSSTDDSGWGSAGGVYFHHDDDHGHWDGGGFDGDCGGGDFSGDCGGGDCGGGGGDCGGGGGECGGGGGDCGGGCD